MNLGLNIERYLLANDIAQEKLTEYTTVSSCAVCAYNNSIIKQYLIFHIKHPKLLTNKMFFDRILL